MELTPKTRLQLAFRAGKQGGLREVARALTWQEFEEFTEECLVSAGFQTSRGLTFRGEGRKWQIDLVARKSQMILVIDCKHWNSPSYPSKFRKAGHHQKLATKVLVHDLETKGISSTERIRALPIILTLFDPRAQLADDVVLVSLEKLADFLNGVTPYSELPFISDETHAENPISQPSTTKAN